MQKLSDHSQKSSPRTQKNKSVNLQKEFRKLEKEEKRQQGTFDNRVVQEKLTILPLQGDPKIFYSKEQIEQNRKNNIIDEINSNKLQKIETRISSEQLTIVKESMSFIDQKIQIRKDKKLARKEAKLAASENHVQVKEIIEADRPGGKPQVVMRWVELSQEQMQKKRMQKLMTDEMQKKQQLLRELIKERKNAEVNMKMTQGIEIVMN